MPITQLISYMMPVLNAFGEKYDYTVPSIDTLTNLPIYIIQGEELDRFYAAQEILMPYGQKVMDTVGMEQVADNRGTYTAIADHTIMLFGIDGDTLPLGLIHELTHYIQTCKSPITLGNVEARELESDDVEEMLIEYYDPEEMDIPRRAMLAIARSILGEEVNEMIECKGCIYDGTCESDCGGHCYDTEVDTVAVVLAR